MNPRLLLPLAGVAALGVGWGGFELYHAPRILPGVVAAGVPVGGLTPAEAAARLKGQPVKVPVVRVKAGDRTLNLNATELGWHPDFAATSQIAYQIGRDGNVLENFGRRFTGNKSLPLSVKVDAKTFRNRLESLAEPFQIVAKSAALVFADGKYLIRSDVSGRNLDFAAAVGQFTADPSLTELNLTVTDVEASTKKADLEPLAAQANAVLRPLALQYTPLGTPKNFTRTLSTSEVANLFFVKRDGLEVDKKAVAAVLARVSNAYDQDAANARYVRSGGSLNKRPSRDGYKLDVTSAQKLLEDEVLRPEATAVVLPVIVSKPRISDDALPQMKNLKLLATGYTRYYGSPRARVANVSIAASKLDGYVVPAGQQFSFNDAVGEISAETGFVEGLVISAGRTQKGVGGGVCQASTTTFNALYRAGLPVVERNQHSYKVHYYDDVAGRDAAVYYGALDLRMTNNTPGPLLVRASTSGSTMTVQVYGVSDGRKVTLLPPRTLSRTPAPPARTVFNASLPAGVRTQVDWSADGYLVTATRVVTDASGAKQSDTLTTRYRPWRAIYEVGPSRAVRPAVKVAAPVSRKPASTTLAVLRTSATGR